MAIVVFDPVSFRVRYPEFASVTDAKMLACFAEAEMYLNNTDCSPVQDIARRAILLDMLVAHILYIGGAPQGGGARPVGRMSDATEGSVAVGIEGSYPMSSSWFQQSQYGAAFWQATSALRGFRYIINPTLY